MVLFIAHINGFLEVLTRRCVVALQIKGKNVITLKFLLAFAISRFSRWLASVRNLGPLPGVA